MGNTGIQDLLVSLQMAVSPAGNAVAGIATLGTGGTVTITTTAVDANSLIFLTEFNASTTSVGGVIVSAKVAGTSFTIQGINILDRSQVFWFIVN